MKPHGGRVESLNIVNHEISALPRTRKTFGRVDDLAPARCYIGRGERRSVMKFYSLADLERIGLAVIGWCWHLYAQIANEVSGRRGIVGIDSDEHAVERCDRMHRGEGGLPVAIEAWRRICWDHERENPATLGRFASGGSR